MTDLAATVALQHHEYWDGSGYPHGLRGERISLEARIVAICDVYDALRERRSYKPALDHDAAMRLLAEGSPDGRLRPAMFDPALLALATAHDRQFRNLYATEEAEGDGLDMTQCALSLAHTLFEAPIEA